MESFALDFIDTIFVTNYDHFTICSEFNKFVKLTIHEKSTSKLIERHILTGNQARFFNSSKQSQSTAAQEQYKQFPASQINLNNKNLQLELQLREAQSHIGFLKQSNKQLLQKLSLYERKCQDMRALEQELDFRRDQQKAMQVHLDNYQQMNNKLRERVALLEQQLKNRESIKKVSRTTCQESDCKQMSRQLSRKSYLNESSIESNRRSIGQAQKQNHPLTPKSRVSINFEKYPSKQIDSMHLIKQRRKVFL